jgi:hypothetical protein
VAETDPRKKKRYSNRDDLTYLFVLTTKVSQQFHYLTALSSLQTSFHSIVDDDIMLLLPPLMHPYDQIVLLLSGQRFHFPIRTLTKRL